MSLSFSIYRCHDEASGEDKICCVLDSDRDYFRLEEEAQRRGKSIQAYLYGEMIMQLKASSFNTPLDSFYVTTERPDEIDTGKPPIRQVTLQ
jgi:hypothetical protein